VSWLTLSGVLFLPQKQLCHRCNDNNQNWCSISYHFVYCNNNN